MDGPERRVIGCGGCLASLGLVLAVGVLAGAVAPRFIPAHRARIDRRAVASLRTIHSAQALFREWDKEVDGVLDYGTLAELSDATLIDGILGGGAESGYRFEVRVSPDEPEERWMAVANPVVRGSGLQSFVIDQAGVVHASDRALVCNDAFRIPASCRPVRR